MTELPSQTDFGKVRVYSCVCGNMPVRPLRGKPKPCDFCGFDLSRLAPKVEDHLRFVERMLKGGVREDP